MTLSYAEREAHKDATYENVVDVLTLIDTWPEEDQLYGGVCKLFRIGAVKYNEATIDERAPALSTMICRFCETMMRKSGIAIAFNAVTVDCNRTQRRLLREKHGTCVFFGAGRYTGGELQVEAEFFVTNNRMIVYDSGLPHAHKYFRGKRFGITCSLVEGSEARTYFSNCELCRPIANPLRISILSRDLGCFNTFVSTNTDKIELPYKRQGIWALKIESDLHISERVLFDTYFGSDTFESTDWDTTLYTVSDTACAASRPLPDTFYQHFNKKYGVTITRIDYRVPFVVFISKIWGNGVMIGNRRLPFYSTLYFEKDFLQMCCSMSMYNNAQGVLFD